MMIRADIGRRIGSLDHVVSSATRTPGPRLVCLPRPGQGTPQPPPNPGRFMDVFVGVDTGDDTRTRRSSPSAMVDMAPFLLTWLGWHARPGGWTRQGAGLIAQAPLRSRSPDRLCFGQGPAHSADRSDQGHQRGLADHRVRPSERDPARFLDDHRNGHADHPCRSRALCEYAERARSRAQIICPERRAVAPWGWRQIGASGPLCQADVRHLL